MTSSRTNKITYNGPLGSPLSLLVISVLIHLVSQAKEKAHTWLAVIIGRPSKNPNPKSRSKQTPVNLPTRLLDNMGLHGKPYEKRW